MVKVGSALEKKSFFVLLLLVGIIYFFFLGETGYVMGRDSITFIENDLKNYWIYTSFLNICERLFGVAVYLEVVVVLQGMLALIVSLGVAYYFKKRYYLPNGETLLIYFATFLPYGYSLPENVATHHILTEGLSFSFFHLFLLLVIMVFLDKKVYLMVPAMIMLVLLIGTRSQLLFLVPVYFVLWIVIGLQWVYKYLTIKLKKMFWLGIAVLSTIVCFIIPFLMKGIVERGMMSQFVDAMSGRVLCTIEEEDVDFMDEQYRGVCQFVFEKIDEKETREVYFRDGLRRWEDILYSTNENTKAIRKWIDEYYLTEGKGEVRLGNEINYLTTTLFERNLVSYFEMSLYLCIQSFVASVFIHPDAIYTLCHVITLFIYLLAIIMTIINIWIRGAEESRVPMYLTGLFLGANVVITNLFFFGQQRYVVYTFGFFYISVFLLCKELWKNDFLKKVRKGIDINEETL